MPCISLVYPLHDCIELYRADQDFKLRCSAGLGTGLPLSEGLLGSRLLLGARGLCQAYLGRVMSLNTEKIKKTFMVFIMVFIVIIIII